MVNQSVSKELDNYGYKFKMNFVIPGALQIYFFSKNKNVIGYMQEANRIFFYFSKSISLSQGQNREESGRLHQNLA